MSTKSPSQFHNTWPVAATIADLPNVLGSATQDAALEVGDLALVTVAGQQYRCVVATLGAARWNPVLPGAYIAGAINEHVVFGDPEITIAEFSFDAGLAELIPIFFRVIYTTTYAGVGGSKIRLYDTGPAAGPPVAPVLVATITSGDGSEGPLRQQSVVSWHDTTPNVGVMVRAERVYRITAEVTVGAGGDEICVGWAGIYVG